MRFISFLIILLFLISFLSFAFSQSDYLNCSIKTSCDAGEVCVLGMARLNNSHVGNCSYGNWKVCCTNNTEVDITTDILNETKVVTLARYENSHVSNDSYPIKVYLKNLLGSNYKLECEVSQTIRGSFVCLFSLARLNNSHVGICDVYPWKISCQYQAISIENLSYDPYIDKTTDNLTISFNVVNRKGLDNIDYVVLRVWNGDTLVKEDYLDPVENVSSDTFRYQWWDDKKEYACQNYRFEIVARNLDNQEDISLFNISFDDLYLDYNVLDDIIVGRNEVVSGKINYCSNREKGNVTIKLIANGKEFSTKTDDQGVFSLIYNISDQGSYNVLLIANDSNFWEEKNFTVRTYYTQVNISENKKYFEGYGVKYNAFQFTVYNPSDEEQTYLLRLSGGVPIRFSSNLDTTLSITVPPNSTYIGYIDVIPTIIGSYIGNLRWTNKNSEIDSGVRSFSIEVRVLVQSGKYIYQLTTENISILAIVIGSFLIILKIIG